VSRSLSPILQRTLSDWLGLAGLPERDPARFQALCRSVADLSRLFTKDRSDRKRSYLDEAALRAGYLAYFLPVNLAKVQALLDELPPGTLCRPADQPLKVLDIGSGPGTGALAVLDWMRQQDTRRDVAVVTVDQALPALQEATELWRAYGQLLESHPASLTRIHVNLERTGSLEACKQEGPFELIVMANTLNELWRGARDPVGSRVTFVRGLLDLLVPHGAFIIIEPALRDTSRDFHLVRDRLLEAGACTVYSPCLHDGPCPALVKADDWCHEERPWMPLTIVAAIDREVGFIKDALKFSYVILRKDGRTIVPRKPDLFRVVSELREMKGEKRAWLCNETGRPEVGRQDRMRSESNAAVDGWHRGAIVRISEIVRKTKGGRQGTVGRIEKSAEVEIVRPV
jgi:ribosomal protein RSM22 (predicted rRNA methylase)